MSFKRDVTADEVDKIFKKRGIGFDPGNEKLELTDSEVDAILGTNYAAGNHKRPSAEKFGKKPKDVSHKQGSHSTSKHHNKAIVRPAEKKQEHRRERREKREKREERHIEKKVKVQRPVESGNTTGAKLRELTVESEYHDLLKRNKRVVIFFGSESCPACKALHPLYERVANRYHEKVALAYADVDKYQINFRYVPVFQMFYRGEKKDEMIGATKDELKSFIAQAIKQ